MPIRTSGDRLATAHLAEVGGKGLFVKEIEDALLEGRVDLAVHSLKDLPAERPRASSSPRSHRGRIRETCWWRAGPRPGSTPCRGGARGHVEPPPARPAPRAGGPTSPPTPIRGNVDTRLRKLRQGEYDALVLAAAGLRAWASSTPDARTALDPEEMLPAVGQGTLGVEARDDDPGTRAWRRC